MNVGAPILSASISEGTSRQPGPVMSCMKMCEPVRRQNDSSAYTAM